MSDQGPHARQRIPSVEPVRLSSVAVPSITESTTTQNVSPRGVRVSTQRIWRPGDHVRIEFLRSGFSAEARVIYWRSFSSSKFAMGLELLTHTKTVVQQFVCHGFQCACGERVTVFRLHAGAGDPLPALQRAVSCKNGHSREVRPDELHMLEQWTESEYAPASPIALSSEVRASKK